VIINNRDIAVVQVDASLLALFTRQNCNFLSFLRLGLILLLLCLHLILDKVNINNAFAAIRR
jgi:hypothetical protein